MNANLKWNIIISDNGRQMGQAITAIGWNVLSRLAAIKAAIPAGWIAEAYPEIHAEITPDLSSIPVMAIIYPPIAYSKS